MMKFIFFLIFLIPFCFLKNMFWLVQLMMFIMMFLFSNIYLKNMFYMNISYMFGMDILSYGLILLSIWICIMMMMASENLFKMNYYLNFFMLNIIFLLLMLFFTFSVLNMFMFYVFFEGSLIPTLMLIIGWGYQGERIQAGTYLLFYTLFSSLPLLMGLFYLYNEFNSMFMYMYKFFNLNYILLYLSMIMAFLVKMPMFFVHLWLPKAHVEAPVSGSMILAGIMLKLGGYGIIRVIIIFQEINFNLSSIFMSISLIGGFYISLMCLSQIDMKSLIAYSSVAHMSMVIGGIITMNWWGFSGAYLLMIGHGLCSSGMFFLANINYERLHSRSLVINKGLMNLMPSLSLWWFLFLSSNMSAPPSLNLLGEISLMNSLMSWSFFTMIFLMLLSFFSAAYSLYLYSYMQHGLYYNGLYSFYMGSSREYLILFLHWIPLNFIIFKVDYFMIW
uniref:NADH-ubiquinone oxidoreductase chain 4 n=1 Tax=Corythoxestis sunosei TaxID=2816377 RepID=A0A899IM32_9NEOP|nr:NADH dehydrogenase subunit 4 [Corythoxestis sunosei]QSL98905.1 NADH dehydrogenase subunit 4 [Corythoxestis sunosei]